MTPVETATLLRHGVTMDIIDELDAAGLGSLVRLANASTPGLVKAGLSEESARIVARAIDRMTVVGEPVAPA